MPPTVIGTGGAQEEPLSVDQETSRVPRGVRMFLPRSHSHEVGTEQRGKGSHTHITTVPSGWPAVPLGSGAAWHSLPPVMFDESSQVSPPSRVR